MKTIVSSIVFIFVFTQHVCSQNFKFGKVTKAELAQTHYEKDSIADAAVLFRKVYISYAYVKGMGFQVNTKIHERIKIYDKEGFVYGTISESLYKSSKSEEGVSGIKAVTYNLVNGEIEKSKLKNSEVFSEESSKYWSKRKFTMPNLKKGSVIEYSYNINSPFAYNLDEIDLQYDIPIALQKIDVATPEYFVFKTQLKGYLPIDIKEGADSGKITFTSFNRTIGGVTNRGATSSVSNSAVDYKINTSSINMTNVPALKEEPYVNNINNYRSAIKYELQYVKFPNDPLKDYTGSWEKVVKTIYERKGFGSQLDSKRYFKDDLPTILQGKTSEKERMTAVFQFVKNRMNWNNIYGYTSDEGVKKAYELKTGNVADINLMLVAMLKGAGLKADPVLISTRSNGVPLFPTREGFNYVVASVKIGENQMFLDATNKFSKPNMLPTRTINWAGRLVHKGGTSESVSLIPPYLSKETVMLNVTVTPGGELEGKARRICKDYVAYSFRNKYESINEENYLEQLEESYNGLEISDYSIKNKDLIGKPVSESYSFYSEDGVELIGDKMYLSPLFWLTISENPFKLDTRDYPIDFTYPREDKIMITLKIPEGYKVVTLPESMSIAIGGKRGTFLFRVKQTGSSTIQIISDLKMSKAVIPAHDYLAVKEFYKTVVEKQAEKVILSKI